MEIQEVGLSNRVQRHLAREIIPILALTASILTFGISYYLSSNQQASAEQRLEAEEIRAAEQEVRSLLQQLYEIGPQLAAAENIYEVDALQKDMTLLASQSFELAGEYSDQLSAFELASIAEALLDTEQHPEADQIIHLAVGRVQTPSEHLFTYRIQGRISFVLGDIEEGRAAFATALEGHPERRFREGFEPAVNAFTEYLWAAQESIAHECEAAATHLANAKVLLTDASAADAAAIEGFALAAQQSVNTCVASV